MDTEDAGKRVYLCSLNLANCPNDENREDLRFGMRFQLLLDTLEEERKNGMSLLVVQEVKSCSAFDGHSMLTVVDIISGISSATGMLPLYCANHDGSTSTWKATFYDPVMFMHLESETTWAGEPSPKPPRFMGRSSFTRNRFYWIGDACAQHANLSEHSGKEFNLVNVHCPVPIGWRIEYCEKLLQTLKTTCGDVPTLCAGDFNTIMDLGGREQLELLRGSMIDKTPTGVTFVGFPGDGNENGPYVSSLDKLFVNQKWQDVFPSVPLVGCFVNIVSPKGLRGSDHFLMRVALA